jgi:hypothetical protein
MYLYYYDLNFFAARDEFSDLVAALRLGGAAPRSAADALVGFR